MLVLNLLILAALVLIPSGCGFFFLFFSHLQVLLKMQLAQVQWTGFNDSKLHKYSNDVHRGLVGVWLCRTKDWQLLTLTLN